MNCAIVDMGSNTVRLSVYKLLPERRYELLFSKKEMAGLANYMEDGALSQAGIRRACGALAGLCAVLRHFPVEETHVFATAPLRNIRNTEEAVRAIRAETGVDVEVLSGELEAELGYYGAMQTLDLRDGAMFDIGGGSTEIVEVRKGELLRAESLPVGSLGLFRRCVSKIWPKRSELDAMRELVEETLAGADLPGEKSARVCGVGGTARAVLKIADAWYGRPGEDRRIALAELRELNRILQKRDDRARQLVLDACPDRIHTILPGALLMEAVCSALCEKELWISRSGVREGYLYRRLLQEGSGV